MESEQKIQQKRHEIFQRFVKIVEKRDIEIIYIHKISKIKTDLPELYPDDSDTHELYVRYRVDEILPDCEHGNVQFPELGLHCPFCEGKFDWETFNT